MVGAWATTVGVRIFVPDGAPADRAKIMTAKAKQVLRDLGTDPLALDTGKMAKNKLRANFKGFNPESVSPDQLGNIGTFLKERGLISDFTASLLLNAGEQFDKYGVQKKPTEKFNAMEYFATQITTIQDRSLNNKQFSNYMLPEYKRAINVLQNLQQFGSTGTSLSVDTRA